MDMIERVARAICTDGGFDPDEMMPNDGPRWRYYDTLARAAIEAMREPTSDMINSVSFWPGPWTHQGFLDNWEAALDAALGEKRDTDI